MWASSLYQSTRPFSPWLSAALNCQLSALPLSLWWFLLLLAKQCWQKVSCHAAGTATVDNLLVPSRLLAVPLSLLVFIPVLLCYKTWLLPLASASLLWARAKLLFFDNQENLIEKKTKAFVMYTCHPRPQEAEAGGSWIWALSGLYTEMLSQTNQQKRDKTAFFPHR